VLNISEKVTLRSSHASSNMLHISNIMPLVCWLSQV